MSAVRELADAYLGELIVLDPTLATRLGLPGHDHRLPDFSPDGAAEQAELARRTLIALGSVPATGDDSADGRCRRLLNDRLGVTISSYEAHEHLRPLRVIGSPVEAIRAVFDQMPTSTDDDWATIAERVEAVPAAYASLQRALESGVAAGLTAAPRQAAACSGMLATWAGGRGVQPWFRTLAERAPLSIAARLAVAANRAAASMGELADWLAGPYLTAAASTSDGVGRERYALGVRRFLGSDLDVDEASQWAWAQLQAIETEMTAIGRSLYPGESSRSVSELLDRDSAAVHGEAELQRWLQRLMDETVESLQGSHFDLAPEINRIEAMIAPRGAAAAQYYTAPSADFRRPGRTWYPTLGRDRFPLWSEYSTCFHEGVPGHHMQIAQWIYEAPRLSRFQAAFVVSGNIEGWALYAERLMDELGFLDDPAHRFGYLVAQQLRAARVIVDIGMHLSLSIPLGQPFHPGERWTADLGRAFLADHALKDATFMDSEWVRYLGWPGQAISYKLGERVWLAGRQDAERRAAQAGRSFDLKAWHMAALSMGSVGLDDLAAELPTLLDQNSRQGVGIRSLDGKTKP